MSKNSLHATSRKFLNDISEFDYGADLFGEVIAEFSKAATSDVSRRFLEIAQIGHAALKLIRVFVFCLSEHENQLSQWRAYGFRGAGYSIGFTASEIRNLKFAKDQRPFLLKVCYDRNRQRQLATEVLKIYLEYIEPVLKDRKVDEVEAELSGFGALFSVDLQLYVMAFKNSAFSEESEWRAVCRVDYLSGIADLEFRASAQEVVPLFTLSPDKGILLPIDSVMVGPRTSPDASEEAVRLLLWKFGYNNFKVTSSQIPLRS